MSPFVLAELDYMLRTKAGIRAELDGIPGLSWMSPGVTRAWMEPPKRCALFCRARARVRFALSVPRSEAYCDHVMGELTGIQN